LSTAGFFVSAKTKRFLGLLHFNIYNFRHILNNICAICIKFEEKCFAVQTNQKLDHKFVDTLNGDCYTMKYKTHDWHQNICIDLSIDYAMNFCVIRKEKSIIIGWFWRKKHGL